ncbi:MAG: NAD(P)/FAD-dependent oxidoreductase [Chloroflexota bacterium]
MNTNTNKTNIETVDVVVIGGGPGGSCLSAYLAQAGIKVVTLEKETFPRYHIGESLTGMATSVLNDFGLGPEMDQRQFPAKGGVKVIGQGAKSEFFVPVLQDTWQVRRAEFDQILLENAVTCGTDHRYGTVKEVIREGDKVVGVRYLPRDEQDGAFREIRCKVVADASGSAALLSKQGIAGPKVYFDEFSRQAAVFTQFKHAKRDPGDMGNNTFIFYAEHLHWGWFIPISPEITSVGVVMPAEKLKACGGAEEAMAWGLEHINPDLGHRVEGCEQMEPIRAVTNYSYNIEPYVGDGWLCVGDAHRFIDPIFSFGGSFAMVEARAASKAILQALETGDCIQPFRDYAIWCDRGQDVALDLIRYFWKYPIFFGYQTRSTMRKDFIRLLGSDCHDAYEMKAVQIMRKGLAKADAQAQSETETENHSPQNKQGLLPRLADKWPVPKRPLVTEPVLVGV